jgi:hypothetical protein
MVMPKNTKLNGKNVDHDCLSIVSCKVHMLLYTLEKSKPVPFPMNFSHQIINKTYMVIAIKIYPMM